MEPGCSLPHSQVPATCPCPEPNQSIPCPLSHFLKIHLNIILPSRPRSSKWSLSHKFPHQNPLCTFPVSHTCHLQRQCHFYKEHYARTHYVIPILCHVPFITYILVVCAKKKTFSLQYNNLFSQ